MISKLAILDLDGEKIVPVRAIPFVTGNLSALNVAKLLADPELNLCAHVLGSGIASSVMFPKEWEPVYSELRSLEDSDPRARRREKIALLPSSTFVYWEGLWRFYEELVMLDREHLEGSSPGKLANFQLQESVNLPKDLVELVFEGFDQQTIPWATSTPATVNALQLVAFAPVAQAQGIMGNSTKAARSNILTPVIKTAQSKTPTPMDTDAVWAQLQAMADDGYVPLLASTDQGIKYAYGGNDKYFTRDALDKRLKRDRNTTQPKAV